MYKRWKENKGITLVSLGVVIAVLLIVSTTLILSVNDRYQAEKLDKLASDLQLLTEKTGIYYLKNKQFPIKDGGKSANINGVEVKELDLTKIDGLTLNYGSGTDEDDYYAIDTSTGTVYYKKGIDRIYNLVQEEAATEIDIIKITKQPEWKSTFEGNDVTFSVQVENDVSYQWYSTDTYDGVGNQIEGATNSTLTIENVGTEDIKYYYCNISYDKDNDGVVDITKKSDVVKLSLKNYIDYKVYGNTIDGVSVGDLETDTTNSNYGRYKIPVTVRGKNLWEFDFKEFNVDTKSVTYTFSEPITKSCTFFYRENNYNSDGNIWIMAFTERNSTVYVYPNHIKKHSVISINASEENPLLKVQIRNGGSSYISAGTIDNFTLVEGIYTADTIPNYEPYVEPKTINIYLNEPLRKLEDKEDCIDFKEQKVVRYIKEENGVLSLIEDGPIEQKIQLPKVVTFEGITNIMSVDTNVQPSKIEAN